MDEGTSTKHTKLKFLDSILFCDRCIDNNYSVNTDEYLSEMRLKGPRQVCQYQFKKNDIVWICKSCQQDDTCVQCNECYMKADHTGHEVFFYHSQAGGCCDCGDSSSWATEGFCSKHGKISADPLVDVPEDVRSIGSKMMTVIAERIVSFTSDHVKQHHITENLKENTTDSTIFNIILYNDDVHTFDEVIDALKDERGLRISDVMRAQDIAEKVHNEGFVCLLQGTFDELYEIARFLSNEGLKVGLVRDEALIKKEAILITLEWMYKVSQTSDGLCRLVCNAFTLDHLVDLLKHDPFYDKSFAHGIHSLYLTLMADQTFKLSLARAYALAFTKFTEYYSSGIGVQETSIYSLSVQFLNRQSIVTEIVEKYSFLTSIVDSLQGMLDLCGSDMQHTILSNRRYNPILGDLKLIFTIPNISRWFCCVCSSKWLSLLGKFQYMHRQIHSARVHVEYEQIKEWMNAFNLFLGLSLLFDYLVNWIENPTSTDPESIRSVEGVETHPLPSVYEFLNGVKVAMFQWQIDNEFTPPRDQWMTNPCMPSCTTSINLPHFPKELSFHLCIHRFLANSIRDTCKYQIHVPALDSLKSDFSKDEQNLLLAIDYPLINIVWACQIKLGMWRRNGQVMKDQLLNYADAPLCRSFRDLDMLFIQFCATGLDSNIFLNHIFIRFDVFKYLGARNATDINEDDFQVPFLEEALIFVIQVLSEIPTTPIAPSGALVDLVKLQLRKEILHRLVSGPKTFSQLQKCLSMIPDFDRCESSIFDAVVDEVALFRESSSTLDPPTLVLRQEVWDDYDPTFVHIPANCHQDALENRPKMKTPKPMVKKFASVHPTYGDLRESLLSDLLLHNFTRKIIGLFAAKRSSNEKYSQYVSISSVLVNDSLYYRALHLITMMVHILKDTDYTSTATKVNAHFKIIEFLRSDILADEATSEGSSSQKVTTVFEALIDVHDNYTDAEESNQKMWHLWVIEECKEIIPECKAIYEARFATATKKKNDKKSSLEARKKMARE